MGAMLFLGEKENAVPLETLPDIQVRGRQHWQRWNGDAGLSLSWGIELQKSQDRRGPETMQCRSINTRPRCCNSSALPWWQELAKLVTNYFSLAILATPCGHHHVTESGTWHENYSKSFIQSTPPALFADGENETQGHTASWR